jgi:hypothetical protein
MKIKHLIYEIQHSVGIQPQWETELIEGDTHLKTFLEWKKSKICCPQKCEQLYHNRLNYLKGWIE